MADDTVGSGSAARVERSNFDTGLEIAVGAAASTTPSQAGQPTPLVRDHQRKAANPLWVANDDRRAEQWENVEEARATRVRKTSASGTRSSSSAQQQQQQRLVPRKTPSTSSAPSSTGSTGPGSLRTAAEATGGGVGSGCGRTSNGHYFKSSAAAAAAADTKPRARGSPQASRRTGSGVDLGDSPAARRTVRHRHSSLLSRADTLSQLSTPSLLSIFSNLTHSSSGSNSTVTQKSYDRSQGIKKRRHSSKHHSDSHHRRSSSKRSESQGSAKLADRAPRRRRRSSQPPTAAYQSAEPGPSQTSCPPAVDCSFATNPQKPSAVARDRVNSDSGISVRDSSPEGTGRAAGRMNGMAAALPWDPQQDEEEEDRQRQLAINRLYQELAARDSQALESAAGEDDHGLQKLMVQEEQLRQHMLRSPPTHHHARDEPHYAHNDDAVDSSRGPTVFPYYYYSDSPSQPQPQPGPYWGHHPDPPPPPTFHVPVHDPGFHHAAVQQPYGQFPPPPSSPRGRGGGDGSGGAPLQPDEEPDLSETTITGYEKLASTLAATMNPSHEDGQRSGADGRRGTIRPLYRRFEYLNHRILLHLQDELAEYEEELRELDECLARRQQAIADGVEAGRPLPASRRWESHYGTDLYTRRTLMLGNIYLKLGQYNSAMTSFAKMLSVLEPAHADDVSAYESWIREHAPISERETRFVTRQADLMAFGKRQRWRQDRHLGLSGDQQQQQGMEETLQTALLALLVFLVLPLIAFPQIPSVGGRLFILTIIGAAEVAVVVSSTRFSRLMSGTEWRICGIAYFTLMAVIAGVV